MMLYIIKNPKGDTIMEHSRKQLKISSYLVLLFALISLIEVIAALILEDFGAGGEATANVVMITKIIIMAVTVIFLIPQVYVGVKGLKIANNPNSSKTHITWATVLFVFSVVSLIAPIMGFINKSGSDNVRTLFGLLLEATIYLEYIIEAKKVAEGK